VLRFLLWRVLALLLAFLSVALLLRLLGGEPGRALRNRAPAAGHFTIGHLTGALGLLAPGWLLSAVPVCAGLIFAVGLIVLAVRGRARADRSYVRLELLAYRGDSAEDLAVARMFAAIHAALAVRWWSRLVDGQPSLSVEIHHRPSAGAGGRSWLAMSVPHGAERIVEAALQGAFPNSRLVASRERFQAPPCLLRLRKRATFIERTWTGERFERDAEPMIDRLLTAMGACAVPAMVQVALTPAPASFERLARHMFKDREARNSRRRHEHALTLDRSLVEEVEMRGALELQHRALFFADIRVLAPSRRDCRHLASVLRAQRAENRLVERGTTFRHGLLGRYDRRVQRGEGNPLPNAGRSLHAPAELAGLWRLPSVDYATVPFERSAVPLAPASPAIMRPSEGRGLLRDVHGPVSIHLELRRQNVAVPGTVDQGKSSLLVASVAEDLQRERCAVIVLDPKGDAAEAALSVVPAERTCTLLDFAHPTCGFNPLAVDAPADVIADYVVAALKSLFTDAGVILQP
jgi:hypothetical protein